MVKEIQLTQGYVALIDDEDYQDVSQFKWQLHRDGKGGLYAKRDKVFMHRYILEPPTGTQIDHINGNGLDNQRANLRFATYAENQQNSSGRKVKSSRFKGVSWASNAKKWIAYIGVDNKPIKIGSFIDEVEAAKAYDAEARKLFGEFARTNFKLGDE
jgi:hypothetical protein